MPDNRIRQRAKALFPTVLLTLLSIVQALALELMWGEVTAQTYLYVWSFDAAVGWLQIVTNLLGVFLIWLIYSDLVLRLSWVPNTIDALFPFLVGILEFAQIEALGPDHFGGWFMLLAALFAAMTWITHYTMRRARREPENAEFFDGVSPASRRDLTFAALPVLFLLGCGVALWLLPDAGWLASAALITACGLMAYQIWLNHGFTQRSYRRGLDEGE